MNVNVLLSGQLKLGGYGKDKPQNRDRTYRLALPEGSTVREVIQGMGIPYSEVLMTMLNGRKCDLMAHVRADDRVALIPPDMVFFWGQFDWLNLAADGAFSY
jgi:hypothetical protein